ncbi:Uncharacterized conserved protein, contains Mth938-like domain [Ectothiorhodospira magna]|uniref:Uncharacterized conserved protein, contains Mth938-like domain n=1 Tax=Ectothiorhodospira magna TaxID=867345 RepID=A0A1H9A849_9GAMM|nr:Mth938-like domain-containing protein [Ectothiorhodospira magna]SEP72623.1 Uncharacterized conserved protein, contains Mth938-like domain [Ectothiorhodospira magna]
MKMTLEHAAGRHLITGHGPGWVRINQTCHRHNLVVMPDTLITDWAPTLTEALSAGSLAPVLARTPDIILLGTGPTRLTPDQGLLQQCMAQGIGLEIMDTPAACRTYNVIASEGRKVAAALVLPSD